MSKEGNLSTIAGFLEKRDQLIRSRENYIFSELGIAEHKEFERGILRFVFQNAADLPSNETLPADKMSTGEISKIGTRYAFYQEFHEDFFKGEENERALLLALLSHYKIHDANAPLPDEDGTLQYTERHFDENDILDAVRIFDDACELERCGNDDSTVNLSSESIFLAHIYSIEYLTDMADDLEHSPFEDYLPEEVRETLREFKKIKTYLRPDTEIGERLQIQIYGLEDELHSACPEITTCLKRNIPFPANDFQ